jgi:DNA invertase Pin-like site-specific DNA recombinase
VIEERASGAKADRPELARVVNLMLRPGDTLVVWKLDRLARSLRQLLDTIEQLRQRGVHFVSLTDAIDTSTPAGMLTFHILGAIAEFERSLIRERTNAGLEAARRNGKIGGRPRLMTEKDALAARALLASRTISSADVAKRFGVSKPTMYRYINELPLEGAKHFSSSYRKAIAFNAKTTRMIPAIV